MPARERAGLPGRWRGVRARARRRRRCCGPRGRADPCRASTAPPVASPSDAVRRRGGCVARRGEQGAAPGRRRRSLRGEAGREGSRRRLRRGGRRCPRGTGRGSREWALVSTWLLGLVAWLLLSAVAVVFLGRVLALASSSEERSVTPLAVVPSAEAELAGWSSAATIRRFRALPPP